MIPKSQYIQLFKMINLISLKLMYFVLQNTLLKKFKNKQQNRRMDFLKFISGKGLIS